MVFKEEINPFDEGNFPLFITYLDNRKLKAQERLVFRQTFKNKSNLSTYIFCNNSPRSAYYLF